MDIRSALRAMCETAVAKNTTVALGFVFIVGFGILIASSAHTTQNASLSATTALANSQGVPTYVNSGFNGDALLAQIPAGQLPSPSACKDPGSYQINQPRFPGWPNCSSPYTVGVFSAQVSSGAGVTIVNAYRGASYWGNHGVGTPTTEMVGAPLQVPSGTTVQLQWVCMPSIYYGYSYIHDGGTFGEDETITYYMLKYYADTFAGSGPGWTASNQLYGTSDVVVTGTPGEVKNFTFDCQLNDASKRSSNIGYGSIPNSNPVTIPIRISDTTISLTASPMEVSSGGTSVLTYSATNASACTLTGPGVNWSQSVAAAPQTFNVTGGGQTYTVPAGVTTLTAKVWGAGGGNGRYTTGGTYAGTGGGGGYSVKNIMVTPGQVFDIIVGKAGAQSTTTKSYTGGGKGADGTAQYSYPYWETYCVSYSDGFCYEEGTREQSETTYENYTSGAGGGLSGVRVSGSISPLVYAGGGGGSEILNNQSGGGIGGAGGGQTGEGVQGATQSAGGTGGSALSGADGVRGTDNYASAGGGGGYYGGGTATGGAGGGSGYCSEGSFICTIGGRGTSAANSVDADLPAGRARGANGSTLAGDGLVRIIPLGNVPSGTQVTPALTSNSTYTLSCIAIGGNRVSKLVTVMVTGSCPTGQTRNTSGVCQCTNGGTITSSCAACPTGETFNSSGICAGSCPTGQTRNTSGVCQCTNGGTSPGCVVPPGSIVSFYATPSRVRSGSMPVLVWSTTNMQACSVTNFARTSLSTLLNTSAPGFSAPAISRTEIYTLSCTDNNGTTSSLTSRVTLIPTVIEI